MVKLIASSFAPLLLIILLHLTLSPATHAELKVWVSNCSSTDGNYTTTSTYKTNLDSLFTKTTTTNLDSGFYNFSAGQSPDTANLISLCLGNINVSGCHTCRSFVIENMKSLCPKQKTAIAWSDDCFVRYSKHSIFATLAEDPGFYMVRGVKATADVLEEYIDVVKTLLEGLPGNASAGDSRVKFASAQADFNSSVTIYAAAQCTPDLSRKECLNCVNYANSAIQTCPDCKGQRGARVLFPSCMVRFEDYKFYQSSDAPAPGTSPSLAPVPSPSPSLEPVPSPSPSLEPVPSPSPSPSLEPGPSTGPSPSLDPVPTPSPSRAPVPPQSPSPSVGANSSVVAPSGSSTVNAAKERIGSRSLIVAIVVVGACFSALL